MNNSFISMMTKVVTKFKDKDGRHRKKLDDDVLNYYDAVKIPEQKSRDTISRDKTVLMKKGIKEEMSAFFLETSCTALTQIYKANSLWKRVVWTVVVIVMLVWMSIQCYWLLEKYYRYPVEVKMDITVSTVLEFPSVTICNLNPILQSKVFSEPYTPLIKYITPDSDDKLYKEMKNNWDYNLKCGINDFRCSNGICVKKASVCDGVQNCHNGEDETNCEAYTCPSYYWKCPTTHICIYRSWRCDGESGGCNQNTTEDEDDCENYQCPSFMWKCPISNKCISLYSRCNGSPGDCNANTTEDEDNCENYQCPSFMWKCPISNKCIDLDSRCNGSPGDCNANTTEDEDNCENYQCPSYMWKCPTTNKCIYLTERCNGYAGACNVNTTEDEDNCENFECQKYFWKCQSRQTCIDIFLRCDGVSGHCNETTTEDEDDCDSYKPPNYIWKCPTQQKYIYLQARCDGNPGDCNYTTTEDEDNCENTTCPENHFRCSSGSCIPLEWMCDNYSDCPEEEDERNCSAPNRVKRYSRNPEPTEPPKNLNGTLDLNAMFENASFKKWTALENGNISSNFYDEKDEEYEAAMTYAYITAKLNASFLEQAGHLKIDLIAACKFGGYQCSPSNFTYLHSHKYGNCYIFNAKLNSKIDNSQILTTRFAGPENGLRLELFLDQDNYVANLASDTGVRVLVHKKGSMPFPEDEGISIMPGRSTSVGIRQISFSRLPSPHGSCGATGKTTDYYKTYLGTDYSKLACLKSCYQDMAINYCGCAVPFYFVPDNVTVCNMTDINIENCVNTLVHDYSEIFENCDTLCPVPCTETKYTMSISTAKWPSEKYKSYLDKRFYQTNYLYRNKSDSDKEFTKLQIYFEDLIYQQVEQAKGYESMNLFSDFGGQLGLWLGLSAITLGEICSFLFGMGRSLSFKCWGNKIKPVQNDLTPIMYIKPATLEEMFEEMCPEAAKYSPPEMTTPLPGSTET